jgi:acylphosphatase
MVFRLIYRSQAVDGLSDADLRSIAMFSSIKNKQLGIAGLLLHFDGHIMQVLEGPKDAVETLYARIKQDPRHMNVDCVYEQECNAPAFETWSMGFRPVECVEDLDVFFTLSKESLDEIVANANEPVRETIEDYVSNVGLGE